MKDSNEQPTISVVIPLYNHEKYIDAALDSVFAQTVSPMEVIVVDDGSTDNSWQKVRLRAHEDSRIIAWSQPNQGAHFTINSGIRRATGEYISILNSDDCYLPERFGACLDGLAAHPEADAVCTALSFFDGRGAVRRNKWYQEAVGFYRKCNDLALALINGNFLMTTSNLFIRREVFSKIGMFSNLRYAHDLDFFLRLIGNGRQIVWLDQPLLIYRMHDANTINENLMKVKIEWAAVAACFVSNQAQTHDWTFFRRLAEIADRHDLTRLLFFFFLQFQRGGTVSPESCLGDSGFMEFMNGVVR